VYYVKQTYQFGAKFEKCHDRDALESAADVDIVGDVYLLFPQNNHNFGLKFGNLMANSAAIGTYSLIRQY
jgi:hypothetical protein